MSSKETQVRYSVQTLRLDGRVMTLRLNGRLMTRRLAATEADGTAAAAARADHDEQAEDERQCDHPPGEQVRRLVAVEDRPRRHVVGPRRAVHPHGACQRA